jgi:DNA gyrase subunit A
MKANSNKKLISEPQIPLTERIHEQSITEEMGTCYLDYAMSVIIQRALPDIRDGLKPVHRRILYAMWTLGLKPSAKFRKSATVVGEVLGKYHPHGDSAVYESMVRLAQDFSMRYPLVWGQGNFGSIDGDSAAAMRYTEAKLSRVTETMLFDLEKDTVDFRSNYDNTLKEPVVLPAKLPNLLINGGMGIAVGMATNIPPHNLTEVGQAIVHLIDHPEATIDDLLEFVKGPDFPTGGIIFDKKEIRQAYITGKGGIVTRAKTDIVEDSKGYFKIIITEIPFQVNKSTLLERMADLVKDKKIEGIKDIRDESDKDGLRIVVELKKDSYPKKVLNRLFKQTQLQDVFYLNLLALVDGIQPRILNLKLILEEYLKHRQEVVRRRIEFDLAKAEARAHILEGLKKALDHISDVINIIRKSKDRAEAKVALIKKFKFTEIQTEAILEMRLHQLANLERQKIEDELKEKMAFIKECKIILGDPKKILGIIKEETKELLEKFGDERRTQVMTRGANDFKQEDLIPNEPCIIMVTQDGYIKRMPTTTFKIQGRGGKGVVGLTTKEEDMVEKLIATNTHSDLLFFTTYGKVFQLKAYEIPVASRQAKGQALVNFLQISPQEKVSVILALEALKKDEKYMVMATREGIIKKTDLADFANVRRSGLIAIKLKEGDDLKWVKPSTGHDDIVLITASGQAIRFKEKDIRPMGRTASGVRGIKLHKDDQVVGMNTITAEIINGDLLVVMSHGYGKRTKLKNYKVQGRGGSGIKTANVTEKTGKLVAARILDLKTLPEDIKGDLIIISEAGQVIRLAVKSVSELGRATQGVRLMSFKKKNDKIASITLV